VCVQGRVEPVVSTGYTCGSFLPACSGAAFPSCTPLRVSLSQTLTSTPVALGIPMYFLLHGTPEPHLFPQGRGSSQLHQFFSSPHRCFGKLSLPLPAPESLIFSTRPRALNVCMVHTFSFCLEGESFRASEAGRAELWWRYCDAGRC